MKESRADDLERRRDKNASTFPVQYKFQDNNEYISIKTNNNCNESQELMIQKALDFHLRGNISEAIRYYKNCIEQGINDYRIFSNYGIILKANGKLTKAKEAQLKAIENKPDFAEAYYNLGNIYKDSGNLKEAEESTRKAIEIKPKFAKAHIGLALILIDLGKYKEAEISARYALELEPNFIKAYLTLCTCLYLLKDFNSALEIVKIAQGIDPRNNDIMLFLFIIKGSLSQSNTERNLKILKNHIFKVKEELQPFIFQKSVGIDLIKTLYKIRAKDAICIDKYQPVIIGNAKGSDFNLFNEKSLEIKTFQEYIYNKLKTIFNSEIFIKDSFVTISNSGGGVKKHGHITKIDHLLKLQARKFSLVYYVSVGDQNCKDPGILKLYNPSKEVLPEEGMVIIFPSDWVHSAFYSGEKDRIIIGINFYVNYIES